MDAKQRIIAAIDVNSFEKAEPLVKELSPYVGMFKAGHELVTAEGAPRVAEFFRSHGVETFLDVKYHDILNTTKHAAVEASRLGVAAFSVHAASGMEALLAARAYTTGPQLWGVTVLTSHDPASCQLIYGAPPEVKVLQFARDVTMARFDGIITSPEELMMLRSHGELRHMDYITPGIRPEWASSDDHERLTTPWEAIRNGATYLVIGRPLTSPPDGMTRTEAAECILREVDNAQKCS